MIRAGLLALLLAAPALAAPPAAAPGTVKVELTTSDGPIVLALDARHAPITTANFLRYVDEHRLDGTSFYRASRTKGAPKFGFIQGGTRNDYARTLPPIRHEPTSKTGLRHTDGTISMARYAPGTANGDFFITVGPIASMDAHPGAKGDNLGFAAFGHVVTGMATVRRILAEPTAKGGDAAMKGQIIAHEVKIVSARRVK